MYILTPLANVVCCLQGLIFVMKIEIANMKSSATNMTCNILLQMETHYLSN